jgi:hypothetical protein
MTDIGPGDCVEAVRDSMDGEVVHARRKDRDIVVEVVISPDHMPCPYCGSEETAGLILKDHGGDDPEWVFCICGWKKVGGSRSDTMRWFASDLTVKSPETEKV